MKVLRQSVVYAPTFSKKFWRMRDRTFENPNFPTKYFLKDVDLFLREAKKEELTVSSLEGVRRVVERAIKSGWLEADYSLVSMSINTQTNQ